MSFQKHSRHVKCCSVDIAVVTTKRLCLKWVDLYQADTSISYYLHEWENLVNGSHLITWQGLCDRNLPYDAETLHSFIETCIDMILSAGMTCTMPLYYRASLLTSRPAHKLKFDEVHSNLHVLQCSNDACYALQTIGGALSWHEADEKCTHMNGSLVSLNSDSEWNTLLIQYYMANHFRFVYILVTKIRSVIYL